MKYVLSFLRRNRLRRRKKAAATPQTLIFVDVDGVLNVGVNDGKSNPICFSMSNLERCEILQHTTLDPADSGIVDRLVAVSTRTLENSGENPHTTYKNMASGEVGDLDVVDVFVRRLAQLIRAAGPQRLVVLSSTWRTPKNAGKVVKLEALISAALKKPFTFDAKTSLSESRGAAGRLKGIRAFIEEHCGHMLASTLRVLVLEDFHASPMNSWTCDGAIIASELDAEAYLHKCIPSHIQLAVKLLHTYDEWRTASGLQVQVGSGLMMKHFARGMAFLLREPDSADQVVVSKPVICPGYDADLSAGRTSIRI